MAERPLRAEAAGRAGSQHGGRRIPAASAAGLLWCSRGSGPPPEARAVLRPAGGMAPIQAGSPCKFFAVHRSRRTKHLGQSRGAGTLRGGGRRPAGSRARRPSGSPALGQVRICTANRAARGVRTSQATVDAGVGGPEGSPGLWGGSAIRGSGGFRTACGTRLDDTRVERIGAEDFRCTEGGADGPPPRREEGGRQRQRRDGGEDGRPRGGGAADPPGVGLGPSGVGGAGGRGRVTRSDGVDRPPGERGRLAPARSGVEWRHAVGVRSTSAVPECGIAWTAGGSTSSTMQGGTAPLSM